MFEITATIIGTVMAALLAVLGYIGNRILHKLEEIEEKVILISSSIYDGETDRIRRIESEISELKIAVYDEKGNNGLVRKVLRLRRSDSRLKRLAIQIANMVNLIRDLLDLKIDRIKIGKE